MRLLKKNFGFVFGQCERCGKKHKVRIDNVVDFRAESVELKSAMQCACGEYHNLISPEGTQTTHTPRTFDYTQNHTLRCDRCNSTQLHADKKGFSLGKALTGGVLIGGAGLLGGFAGKNKVMITCLNCGYKWQAGK